MFTEKFEGGICSLTTKGEHRREFRLKELHEKEARLWFSVILQAICDLDNPLLPGVHNTQDLQRYRLALEEDAKQFFLNKGGALKNICNIIGWNDRVLTQAFLDKGAKGLKSLFLQFYKKREH